MYKYNNLLMFFNNVSETYMLSTITVFFAVVIALYCAYYSGNKSQHKVNGEDTEPCTESEENDLENDICTEDDLNRGLLAKLKSSRLKELENALTSDQKEEEKVIEREQLAAIFELLKKQEVELHTNEIDEVELKEQLRLYR